MIEWRDVVGFEGEYEVSSDGQIRSKDRVRKYYRNGKELTMSIRGRMRTPSNSWDGYKEIHLQRSDTGKSYYARVHRIVAEAFIPNPTNLPQINHIDGNKQNNCVDNLEWVTAKENTAHAIQKLHGVWMKNNKSSCLRVKCLDEDIWFDSMIEASKWAGGNPTNLIIAMKQSKPYKGHVFLRESELSTLDIPESDYVHQLMSNYRGCGKSISYTILGSNGERYTSQSKFAKAYGIDPSTLSQHFKQTEEFFIGDVVFTRIKE